MLVLLQVMSQGEGHLRQACMLARQSMGGLLAAALGCPTIQARPEVVHFLAVQAVVQEAEQVTMLVVMEA